jgi:hypothetical protein
MNGKNPDFVWSRESNKQTTNFPPLGTYKTMDHVLGDGNM